MFYLIWLRSQAVQAVTRYSFCWFFWMLPVEWVELRVDLVFGFHRILVLFRDDRRKLGCLSTTRRPRVWSENMACITNLAIKLEPSPFSLSRRKTIFSPEASASWFLLPTIRLNDFLFVSKGAIQETFAVQDPMKLPLGGHLLFYFQWFTLEKVNLGQWTPHS